MSKGAYIGVGNSAKKIKNIYIGVNGVAKKVKKAYIGVNNVAKLWWSSGATANLGYPKIVQSLTPSGGGNNNENTKLDEFSSIGKYTLIGMTLYAGTAYRYTNRLMWFIDNNELITTHQLTPDTDSPYIHPTISSTTNMLFVIGGINNSDCSNDIYGIDKNLTITSTVKIPNNGARYSGVAYATSVSFGSHVVFTGGLETSNRTDDTSANEITYILYDNSVLSKIDNIYTGYVYAGDYGRSYLPIVKFNDNFILCNTYTYTTESPTSYYARYTKDCVCTYNGTDKIAQPYNSIRSNSNGNALIMCFRRRGSETTKATLINSNGTITDDPLGPNEQTGTNWGADITNFYYPFRQVQDFIYVLATPYPASDPRTGSKYPPVLVSYDLNLVKTVTPRTTDEITPNYPLCKDVSCGIVDDSIWYCIAHTNNTVDIYKMQCV